MGPSTRTPEGEPSQCPVCGQRVWVDPSRPPGDAPCPKCGTLLWFGEEPDRLPDGRPKQCPVCEHLVWADPAKEPGDTPCPHCGALLWFGEERVPPVAAPAPPPITAWQYGLKLLNRGDVESALALFQNVVVHQPADVSRRRELREMTRRLRFGQQVNEQAASVVLVEVCLAIEETRHRQAGVSIDWESIDRAIEQGLAIDPWNVDLHVELGDVCETRGYRDAAVFAYQCALQAAPDRDDVRQRIADLFRTNS